MIPPREDIAALPGGAAALAARDLDALAALVPPRRVQQLVPIADIQARLQSSGVWWAIKGALSSGLTGSDTKAAAQAVMDVASARYENVDLSIPLVSQMFGALVAVELMPQAVLDDILAMAWRDVPFDRLDFEGLFE